MHSSDLHINVPDSIVNPSIAAMQRCDVSQCKAILSLFALDPGRSYALWKKKEGLADFIVERVKATSEGDKVFLS